jgi:putative FmdB family regulatory protein
MPLYEYRCHKCGARFEAIQKFSDAPLAEHANCGGEVERLISAPALQFKGSGWYITDYAKAGAGSKEGSKGESAGSNGGQTETKSDKKVESAPASTAAPSTPAPSSSSKSS